MKVTAKVRIIVHSDWCPVTNIHCLAIVGDIRSLSVNCLQRWSNKDTLINSLQWRAKKAMLEWSTSLANLQVIYTDIGNAEIPQAPIIGLMFLSFFREWFTGLAKKGQRWMHRKVFRLYEWPIVVPRMREQITRTEIWKYDWIWMSYRLWRKRGVENLIRDSRLVKDIQTEHEVLELNTIPVKRLRLEDGLIRWACSL